MLGTLAFAVVRPKGLPEAVAAVPAALAVILLGIVSVHEAEEKLAELAPTIGFLAAVLVLASCATGRACSRRPGTGSPAPPGARRWRCSGSPS